MGISSKNIADHLDDLPLLPGVVTRMLGVSWEDDNYFEQILPLAEQDPAFALRIIKLANSSAFRPISPINDLNSAVTRIGAHQIATLITSLAVMRIFIPSKIEVQNLWLHSIQVAVAASHIAHKFLKLDPAEAYLCGLMHDIGRFILFDVATGDVRQIDESGWSSPEQLIDAEMKQLGIDHAELGWHVCKKWMMPEHISMIVKLHHSKDIASICSRDKELYQLIRLVQLADNFSMLLLQQSEITTIEQQEAIALLQSTVIAHVNDDLSITASQLHAIISIVIDESIAHCTALGLSIT